MISLFYVVECVAPKIVVFIIMRISVWCNYPCKECHKDRLMHVAVVPYIVMTTRTRTDQKQRIRQQQQ